MSLKNIPTARLEALSSRIDQELSRRALLISLPLQISELTRQLADLQDEEAHNA